MHDWQNVPHVRWECKYHKVVISNYRKRMLYGKLKKHVVEVIKEVCRQRGIDLIESHLMPNHIHLCPNIPPKQSVAFAIEFIKGKSAVCKSAVRIHRQTLGKKKVMGRHLWSREYCVGTVGLNEETIRKFIREQEALENRHGGCPLCGWSLVPIKSSLSRKMRSCTPSIPKISPSH